MSLKTRTGKLGIKYFGGIYRADHCVYRGVGTPTLYLGGRVVVGSEIYKNPMPTL